jgi:hypothetical protein
MAEFVGEYSGAEAGGQRDAAVIAWAGGGLGLGVCASGKQKRYGEGGS